MVIEVHNIGEAATSILKNHVIQKIFDGINGMSAGKSSITSHGNRSTIYIPFLATDDISREAVLEQALNTQMKIAWDVRRVADTMLANSSSDVGFDKVMKALPVTIIQKSTDRNAIINEIVGDNTKISVVKAEGSDALSYNLEMESLSYAVKVLDNKMYSEAEGSLKAPVIHDRNSLPTEVQIEIKYSTEHGKVEVVKYFIAVSVVPRAVTMSELATRIATYDNKRFYRNLVSLEKGELSFISGLMLDWKLLVKRAESAAKGKDPLFNVIDKFKMLTDMGVNIYPFLCIMVSENFVNMLDKENFNMRKERDKILKTFCAMGLFIYDTDTEIIEIYYDGDRDSSKYHFSEIEKDTSRYEKQLKEMIKFNIK